MPIEIRELVIRASVSPERSESSGLLAPARRVQDPGTDGGLSARDVEQIVGLCTERVLRAMARAQER